MSVVSGDVEEVDSDESDNDVLSEGDEPKGFVYTNPCTGERFTVEELQNDPDPFYKNFKIPKCSTPGHSCRQNYEEMTRRIGNAYQAIPEIKEQMRVVYRDQWGARPPSAPPEELKLPALKVVCSYHPAVPPCFTAEECVAAVRELQRRHMDDLGLPDIAYNWIVGGDMTVYEGRGWHNQPDDALKYPQWRHRRLDVAFIAPIDRENGVPDGDILDRSQDFLEVGVLNNDIHVKYDIYENKTAPYI